MMDGVQKHVHRPKSRGSGGGGGNGSIYKTTADEVRTAFRSQDPTTPCTRRLPKRLHPRNYRSHTWPRRTRSSAQTDVSVRHTRARARSTHRPGRPSAIAVATSYVPSAGPSASATNGSAKERQFVRQPTGYSETSVETVPGQQRQLSAGDHQVRPGELEQALEELGEHVHGRSRPPPQGTRSERGQRAAAAGERRERQTRDRVRDDRCGRGRQVPAIARVRDRPLYTYVTSYIEHTPCLSLLFLFFFL